MTIKDITVVTAEIEMNLQISVYSIIIFLIWLWSLRWRSLSTIYCPLFSFSVLKNIYCVDFAPSWIARYFYFLMLLLVRLFSTIIGTNNFVGMLERFYMFNLNSTTMFKRSDVRMCVCGGGTLLYLLYTGSYRLKIEIFWLIFQFMLFLSFIVL